MHEATEEGLEIHPDERDGVRLADLTEIRMPRSASEKDPCDSGASIVSFFLPEDLSS
jgi:hypothetical protein